MPRKKKVAEQPTSSPDFQKMRKFTDEESDLVIGAAKTSPDPLDRNLNRMALVQMTTGGPKHMVKSQNEAVAELVRRLATHETDKSRKDKLLAIAKEYEPHIEMPPLSRAQKKRALQENIHYIANKAGDIFPNKSKEDERIPGIPKEPPKKEATEKEAKKESEYLKAEKEAKRQDKKSYQRAERAEKTKELVHAASTTATRTAGQAATATKAVARARTAQKLTKPKTRKVHQAGHLTVNLRKALAASKKRRPKLKTGKVKLPTVPTPPTPKLDLPRTARMRQVLGR